MTLQRLRELPPEIYCVKTQKLKMGKTTRKLELVLRIVMQTMSQLYNTELSLRRWLTCQDLAISSRIVFFPLSAEILS